MFCRVTIPVLFACLVIFSCNNQSSAPAQSTIEEVADSATAEMPYRDWLPELFTFIANYDSSFDAGAFDHEIRLSSDSILQQQQDSTTLQPFLPFLAFNADSSYALDYVSAGYVPSRKGNRPVIEAGGPDTELALINLKKMVRQRIAFLGSSGTVITAKWISATEFVVALSQEDAEGKLGFGIWKCAIDSREKDVFTYKGSLSKQINDYPEKELNARAIKTSRAF